MGPSCTLAYSACYPAPPVRCACVAARSIASAPLHTVPALSPRTPLAPDAVWRASPPWCNARTGLACRWSTTGWTCRGCLPRPAVARAIPRAPVSPGCLRAYRRDLARQSGAAGVRRAAANRRRLRPHRRRQNGLERRQLRAAFCPQRRLPRPCRPVRAQASVANGVVRQRIGSAVQIPRRGGRQLERIESQSLPAWILNYTAFGDFLRLTNPGREKRGPQFAQRAAAADSCSEGDSKRGAGPGTVQARGAGRGQCAATIDWVLRGNQWRRNSTTASTGWTGHGPDPIPHALSGLPHPRTYRTSAGPMVGGHAGCHGVLAQSFATQFTGAPRPRPRRRCDGRWPASPSCSELEQVPPHPRRLQRVAAPGRCGRSRRRCRRWRATFRRGAERAPAQRQPGCRADGLRARQRE